MKLIHLSDLHLGKSKNTERFVSVIDWIISNKSEHDSKVVLITGDIVDDGKERDFKDAKRQIDRLKAAGCKVLAVPGNHDYGAYGLTENKECVKLFLKYLGKSIKYPHVEKVDNFSFILLDSMLQEMKDFNFWGAQGKLGKKQLHKFDTILDTIKEETPEQKIIVALHHHPFYFNYTKKLRDEKEFKKIIFDEDHHHARINGLLFGHKHVAQRFDVEMNKEKKYHIGMIYASGSSTERDDKGNLIISILDFVTNSIREVAIP